MGFELALTGTGRGVGGQSGRLFLLIIGAESGFGVGVEVGEETGEAGAVVVADADVGEPLEGTCWGCWASERGLFHQVK